MRFELLMAASAISAVSRALRRAVATAASLCLIASAGTAFADPECDDVAERGHLNVLTINPLFSEIATRDQRLSDIAAFMADNEVDVALLQEVVGGALAETNNSARDLQDILSDDLGHDYELRTAFEVGIPGLLAVANAVLSRCDIRVRLVKRLTRASEIEFKGETIRVPRNVVMVLLAVPGIAGRDTVNVYNTHLCASCQVAERQQQLDELLEFVEQVEDFLPLTNPVVLGGDFNIDIFRDAKAERPLYDAVLDAGFIDGYAAAQGEPVEQLCDDPSAPDEHCTVGVSELDGNNARRIDYVFTRRFAGHLESRVVFNPFVDDTQPTVSDHAGVFVRLNLP
jgi:maltose 6'-phosphate phosphatase